MNLFSPENLGLLNGRTNMECKSARPVAEAELVAN